MVRWAKRQVRDVLIGAVALVVIAGALYAIPPTRGAIYGKPAKPTTVQLAALITRTVDKDLARVGTGCLAKVCGVTFTHATTRCVGMGSATDGPGEYACAALLRTSDPDVGFREQWRGMVSASQKMRAVLESHGLRKVRLTPHLSSGTLQAGGSCSAWLGHSVSARAAFVQAHTTPRVSASFARTAAAYGTAMCEDGPQSAMPSSEQMVTLASAAGHTDLDGG